MDSLVNGLIESGAPWGILCAVLIYFIINIWKRYNILIDKLHDLSIEQVKINSEMHNILNCVEKDIEDINKRL